MQAEFESRCEMYEAQVTKMQRSLERGDTEKAKVEEELAKAMALTAQGDRQVRLTLTRQTQLCHAKTAALSCCSCCLKTSSGLLDHDAAASKL